MTVFNILNTRKSIDLEYVIKQQDFNKPFNPLNKKGTLYKSENEKSFLAKINIDNNSLTRLEENITDALLFHADFLNNNLPTQVDIEIVRETKTEQLEHYLRRDNKFFFKTIQELFLSKEKVKKKKQQDRVSAESVQRSYSRDNIPRLKFSTDFAKEFDYKNPPKIFDKFLTELRRTIPNSPKTRDFTDSNKVITELMVLHEAAHLILDNKVNKTYLKLAYELNNDDYDGFSVQSFVRLIHEGFADGITTYLAKEHYPNSDVTKCYSNARKNTNHKTESRDKINIYDTVYVMEQVNNSNSINKTDAVDYILDLAVVNALDKLASKMSASIVLKDRLLKDLKFLEDKKAIQLDADNIIDTLRKNIFAQLNDPLPMEEILLRENISESQKQTFKNMELILDRFRTDEDHSSILKP